MLRRRASAPVAPSGEGTAELPRYPGPLATTLGTAPIFRTVVRGYDRVQVDGYVTWAEDELLTERRAIREVVGQFRDTVGELERSRGLPVQSAEAQQLLDISACGQRILATAADEATALLSAAAAEADRVVTEAHREARARLESVRLLRQRVTTWCVAERERIDADRAEARRLIEEARAEAAVLLEDARRQRAEEDRAAEAARARDAEEASLRLAAASSQLDGLQRQWRELIARLRSTDGLVAHALALLDRDAATCDGPPSEAPVQQLPRSA